MKHEKLIINGVYVPVRMCVACRTVSPKKDLLRLIKNENGEIVIDKKRNANCRGAYICNNKSCIEKAQKIRALERVFKCCVTPKIYEECLIFEI